MIIYIDETVVHQSVEIYVSYNYSAPLYSKNRSYTIYIPYKKLPVLLVESKRNSKTNGNGGTKKRVFRSTPLPDT